MSWRAFDDVGDPQCNTFGEEADYTECRQNGFSCVDHTYTHVIADHYNALCLLHVNEQNSSFFLYTLKCQPHRKDGIQSLFLELSRTGLLTPNEKPQHPSSVCLVPLPKHFNLFRISVPLLHSPQGTLHIRLLGGRGFTRNL